MKDLHIEIDTLGKKLGMQVFLVTSLYTKIAFNFHSITLQK